MDSPKDETTSVRMEGALATASSHLATELGRGRYGELAPLLRRRAEELTGILAR